VSRDAQMLSDEIALREASLADAARELRDGELSGEAYEAIVARERAAIAVARTRLEELASAAPAESQGTRTRKKRYLVVAALCFALVVGVVLWAAVSPRQAGNSITGSLQLGRAAKIQQLLGEAEADIANANVVAALSAYQQVLSLDATNVQALTQSGWLDFSAGSSDRDVALTTLGVKYLREAVTLAPRNPAPRLYYAIVADSTPGNRALAKSQFEIFLALKPSLGQLAIAKPFLKQLGLSG
jgi:cytochrome c-type biogenesis protein CcmH/NrfG